MDEDRTYIVVVDAIVGRGHMLRRGQVLAEKDLWGMATQFIDFGAVAIHSDEFLGGNRAEGPHGQKLYKL